MQQYRRAKSNWQKRCSARACGQSSRFRCVARRPSDMAVFLSDMASCPVERQPSDSESEQRPLAAQDRGPACRWALTGRRFPDLRPIRTPLPVPAGGRMGKQGTARFPADSESGIREDHPSRGTGVNGGFRGSPPGGFCDGPGPEARVNTDAADEQPPPPPAGPLAPTCGHDARPLLHRQYQKCLQQHRDGHWQQKC